MPIKSKNINEMIMEERDLSHFQKTLQYRFKNKALLAEALSHRSFVNEQTETHLHDNERLEFLGDAVINLAIGHILMDRFPDVDEGDLSRMRARLVNENRLARVAEMLDIGSYIRLGKGEIQTKGRKKKSILADAFEAIIAAVFLDSNYDTAFTIVHKHFSTQIDSTIIPTINDDYKTRLQELVQSGRREPPIYRIIDMTGPDHDKTFSVQLQVWDIETRGKGKSKKTAEQDAAKNALEILQPINGMI